MLNIKRLGIYFSFTILFVMNIAIYSQRKNSACQKCFTPIKRKDDYIITFCQNNENTQRHVFHKRCITEWTKLHDLCPACSTQLPTQFVDKIDLEENLSLIRALNAKNNNALAFHKQMAFKIINALPHLPCCRINY